MINRWNNYSEYLSKKYGKRVYRIGVDAALSCPNRDKDGKGGCIFCDLNGSLAVYQRDKESSFNRQSSFEETIHDKEMIKALSIEDQIEKGKRFARYRYKTDLVSLYFQSWSNTYGDIEKLKRIYDEALSYGPFVEFIISTRPDLINEEICSLLASYQTKEREVWVELGLQTANDETLKYINRGHDSACYVKAVNLLHKYNIKVATHIMLSLPNEGKEDYLKTVEIINLVKTEGVKIHNLHITGNTELYNQFMQGCITVSSYQRHLEDTALVLANLNPNILVMRLLSETPMHRLCYPRHYKDKRDFLEELDIFMKDKNLFQGSRLQK